MNAIWFHRTFLVSVCAAMVIAGVCFGLLGVSLCSEPWDDMDRALAIQKVATIGIMFLGCVGLTAGSIGGAIEYWDNPH